MDVGHDDPGGQYAEHDHGWPAWGAAVVGCGNATTRIHSGDRIRVDGGRGTVEILRAG